MTSKRHIVFNIALILLPWFSVLFLGKRSIKRFSLAGLIIVLIEIITQLIGQKRNWWVFFDQPKSFLRDLVPFSIGPYLPMSMWMLKLSYGNLKKFLLLNAIANGAFAFPGVKILNKLKIADLYRLNGFQFFLYLFSKAFLLYGVQYFVGKRTIQK